MPKIAVYAGHGGSDPGAVGNGLLEKNLNLAISNEVSRILRQKGYQVVNNRTTDKDRSISADARLANSQNVDALVEIHQNSSSNPQANGTETIYSVKDTGKGKALATAINSRLAALGFRDRGIKTQPDAAGNDRLGILRLTNAPSSLVEVAFISNPQDMARLDVNKAAKAIADGIMQVFPVSSTPSTPSTPSTSPTTNRASVIKNIQSTLNQRYNTKLTVDGVAGANTKKALVKGLQTELNRQFGAKLVTDGVYGPATRNATRSIRKGATGNITWLIQAALYTKGYDTLPDGKFGSKTESAVKSYQKKNGLVADGIAGPATQNVLFR